MTNASKKEIAAVLSSIWFTVVVAGKRILVPREDDDSKFKKLVKTVREEAETVILPAIEDMLG